MLMYIYKCKCIYLICIYVSGLNKVYITDILVTAAITVLLEILIGVSLTLAAQMCRHMRHHQEVQKLYFMYEYNLGSHLQSKL